MDTATLAILRCPACRGELTPAPGKRSVGRLLEGSLRCDCERTYRVHGGIADLTHPESLLAADEVVKGKYDRGADQYDAGLDWLFKSFGEEELSVRREMVKLLDAKPGQRILEVGCGTGKDSAVILEQLRDSGELHVQDLSRRMLELASERLADSRVHVEYSLGNAAYLPYADEAFDAVFHFGGINTFAEKGRSVAEMDRVVRPGGKVVIGDEGLPPWLRKTLYGRILIHANRLYEHHPPLDLLPETARQVRVRWLLGNAFYLIDYASSDQPLPLDLDRPIPGKLDTLRSRFGG